jgi:hypothetical protein
MEVKMRVCFCPYLDGPEICGLSYHWRYSDEFYGCNAPYTGNGRDDCPIIKERGDK